MFNFQYPYFFLLFIVIFIILLWYNLKGYGNEAVLRFSDLKLIQENFLIRAKYKNRIVLWLKIIIISLIIIALARPRKTNIITDSKVEIVDIKFVEKDDHLLVLPGGKGPVDGRVLNGKS